MAISRKTAQAWGNFPLRIRGLMFVAVPVAALLLSLILIGQLERQKDAAQEQAKRTQDVRAEVLNTYVVMISVESAVRDYALTGHEEGLQAQDNASTSIDVILDRIKDLVHDNPEQMQRWGRLKELVHRRLDGLKALRAYYDSPQNRGKEAPHEPPRQGKASKQGTFLELTRLYT